MLLYLKRWLAAPELDSAGGGVTGPGDAPPGGTPTPSPEPEPGDQRFDGPPDDGGDDGGTPPDDQTGRPDPFEARAQRRAGKQDNAIPYSRVKQMLAEAEKRAEARFRQQMEPVLKELHPDRIRAGIAESMLASLGYQPKKPEPKFITQEEFHKALLERDQRHQQELQRATEEQQATRDLEAAKTSHREIFEAYPDLEEDCANLWASKWAVENRVTMRQIIDHKVKKIREAVGKLNASYQAEKEEDREVPTPARPGSAGTPRAPKKLDLGNDEVAAEAALAMLQGRRR